MLLRVTPARRETLLMVMSAFCLRRSRSAFSIRGADCVAAFTGVGGQSVQRGLGDGHGLVRGSALRSAESWAPRVAMT